MFEKSYRSTLDIFSHYQTTFTSREHVSREFVSNASWPVA